MVVRLYRGDTGNRAWELDCRGIHREQSIGARLYRGDTGNRAWELDCTGVTRTGNRAWELDCTGVTQGTEHGS